MAWWFGHDLSLLQYLINFETGKQTILGGWCCLLHPVGSGLPDGRHGGTVVGPRPVRATSTWYSAVTGISLSYIFLPITRPAPSPRSSSSPPGCSAMAIAGLPPARTSPSWAASCSSGHRHHHRLGGQHVPGQRHHGLHHQHPGRHHLHRPTAYDVQKLKRMGGVVPPARRPPRRWP